jgi:hypothetical protein
LVILPLIAGPQERKTPEFKTMRAPLRAVLPRLRRVL